MTGEEILVPIDFSPSSVAAVQYSAMIARSLNASITLLHVYEPPTAMVGIVPGADATQDLERERLTALTNLKQLSKSAASLDGIPLKLAVEVGYATRNILEHARVANTNLIIIGTHGRTGFARLILGSVAQGVLRFAKCPVITVHLPEAI